MPSKSKLKEAIDSGEISYGELETIIKRFQAYENKVITGDEALEQKLESLGMAEGIEEWTPELASMTRFATSHDKNLKTQPLGERFNRMRKWMPIERSASNHVLKLIQMKKQ
jgi:hypothetical protein